VKVAEFTEVFRRIARDLDAYRRKGETVC